MKFTPHCQFFMKRLREMNYQQFCNINQYDHNDAAAREQWAAFHADTLEYMMGMAESRFQKFVAYFKVEQAVAGIEAAETRKEEGVEL